MSTGPSVEEAGALQGSSFADGLVKSIASGLILVDRANRSASLAGNAAQILGVQRGESGSILFAKLPVTLAKLADEVFSQGKPISDRRVKIPGPQGELTLCVEGIPFPAGDQRNAVALLLNDLTPIQRVEEQLVRLDRLASMGTLAAGMAHEVKNALVACKTFVDLLLEKNQEAELAQIVQREMGRIDALVSGMLKFAGRSAANYGTIRVHEILEHSLRLLERKMEEKSIVVTRSLAAEPDTVEGDEHELQQALVNLLLNALEAMDPKGTLSVGSARGTRVGGGSPHSQVNLFIQDTGVGIPAEILSHLFEPFITTKPSGNGLGLAITRQIIHRHRGTIVVQSQPGQGTTFTISLPASPTAA